MKVYIVSMLCKGTCTSPAFSNHVSCICVTVAIFELCRRVTLCLWQAGRSIKVIISPWTLAAVPVSLHTGEEHIQRCLSLDFSLVSAWMYSAEEDYSESTTTVLPERWASYILQQILLLQFVVQLDPFNRKRLFGYRLIAYPNRFITGLTETARV